MSRFNTLSIPLIAGLLIVTAACGLADAENAQVAQAPSVAPANAMRVETAVLQRTEASIDISMPGEIEGSRDANLASALGGFVESVPVKPGQKVRTGTVIARIDGDLYAAGVTQAQAQLDQATAEQARLDKLGDLATDQQRLSADTQVRLADAGLQQARAQQKRAVVTAPFSGTVADTFVEAGEVTGPGATVARLVRLDPVIVTLAVPDRDVVTLTEGLPVAVTLNARAGIYEGEITHIAKAADTQTRSFRVEVSVPNPEGELLPGMIARVRAKQFVQGQALVIPQDWLVTQLNDQGVFVVSDDVATWRSVELGSIVRDQVVVTAGLQPGDRIVINGHRNLVNGDPLIVSREGTCCKDGRAVWKTED